jgi:hypothetical protein
LANDRGTYRLRSLAPGRYTVCAFGGSLPGSRATFGGRCWRNVAWNERSVPRGAAVISTSAGATRTGVNLFLPQRTPPRVVVGAISGTVTDNGGHALRGALAEAFATSGRRVASVQVRHGSYDLRHVPVSPRGYRVCVAGAGASYLSGAPAPADGFASACFRSPAWPGGDTRPPHTARLVPVHAGATHTGVNLQLGRAGRITGTVTNHDTGDPLQHVDVLVLDSANRIANETSTAADGSYAAAGLTPGPRYKVCFAATPDTAPTYTVSYLNQCWFDQDWPGHR